MRARAWALGLGALLIAGGVAVYVLRGEIATRLVERQAQGAMRASLAAQLPDGLDAAQIAREALVEGVVLAPGNVFSVSRSAGDFLRFNVSQCNRPKVYETLQRAMERVAQPA